MHNKCTFLRAFSYIPLPFCLVLRFQIFSHIVHAYSFLRLAYLYSTHMARIAALHIRSQVTQEKPNSKGRFSSVFAFCIALSSLFRATYWWLMRGNARDTHCKWTYYRINEGHNGVVYLCPKWIRSVLCGQFVKPWFWTLLERQKFCGERNSGVLAKLCVIVSRKRTHKITWIGKTVA